MLNLVSLFVCLFVCLFVPLSSATDMLNLVCLCLCLSVTNPWPLLVIVGWSLLAIVGLFVCWSLLVAVDGCLLLDVYCWFFIAGYRWLFNGYCC